jgi:hypothetical protein
MADDPARPWPAANASPQGYDGRAPPERAYAFGFVKVLASSMKVRTP